MKKSIFLSVLISTAALTHSKQEVTATIKQPELQGFPIQNNTTTVATAWPTNRPQSLTSKPLTQLIVKSSDPCATVTSYKKNKKGGIEVGITTKECAVPNFDLEILELYGDAAPEIVNMNVYDPAAEFIHFIRCSIKQQ